MLKIYKSISNSNGNSLVAILLGAGIMGVIMVGMMDSVNMALKGQRTVDTRLATSEFENEIYSLLAVQNICTYNWGNDTVTADDINNVKSVTELKSQNTAGVPIVRFTSNAANNLYEQGRIRLKSMELRDFQPAGTAALPSEDAMATLRLNLERVGSVLGAKEVIRDITISIDLKDPYPTTPNPFVEFCQAVGGMGDQIWTQKPNKDIYYNGGNVGIGTMNPVAPFHVRGPVIRIDREQTAGSGPSLDFYEDATHFGQIVTLDEGGNGSSLNFYTKINGGGLGGPKMTITNDGKIGVGTTTPELMLDVTGGIRPGSSATVTNCGMGAANGEGTQRYNYATHKMEYCNGTGWTPTASGEIAIKSAFSAGPTVFVGLSHNIISLNATSPGSPVYISFSGDVIFDNNAGEHLIKLFRNGTQILQRRFLGMANKTLSVPAFTFKDNPPAGAVTYLITYGLGQPGPAGVPNAINTSLTCFGCQ